MKPFKILSLCLFSFSFALHAAEEISFIHHIEASLASETQMERLKKVLFSIPSDDHRVNAMELNKALEEEGLPTIDVDSSEFKVEQAYLAGFSEDTFLGVSFSDGKHKFCMPCTLQGWNNFGSGIVKVSPSAAK